MCEGYGLGAPISAKKEPKDKDTPHKDAIMLKWSTPKSTSLELQFCTSAYRVTPMNVSARVHVLQMSLGVCVCVTATGWWQHLRYVLTTSLHRLLISAHGVCSQLAPR